MASKRNTKIFDSSTIPLFLALGLIGLVIGYRWLVNPPVMATDGIIVVIIGFFYLLRIKYSTLRRGFWRSADPTQSTDVEARSYKTAFAIIGIGLFLVLLGNSSLLSTPP